GATTTCNVPVGWNGHVAFITARAVHAARHAPTITPPTDSHIVRHWYLDPRVRHSSRRNSVACGQRSFGSNSMARRNTRATLSGTPVQSPSVGAHFSQRRPVNAS